MSSEIKPNLLKPRWSKVFSDLWDDKTRTLLVVASIAVGVFAVGMIISAFVILGEDINRSYASINPPNIEVWTDPFYKDFVRAIDKLPGVKEVEGRRVIGIRGRRGDENWQNLSLVGVNDFENILIGQLDIINGSRIPGNDEAIVSQDILDDTGFQVGDVIEIELPDSSVHKLIVVGLVTDQTKSKPDPTTYANAFVTLKTLRSFGLESYFNHLLITVDGGGSDSEIIANIAGEVEDQVEKSHREVYRSEEKLSNEHPMTDTILAVIGVLGALGGLITILSSSLIINTLNALLTQQLRQIGIMKLVGGRSYQILGMYLTLIVVYSLIALVLSIPLGAMAGYGLANYIAYLLGAVLQGFRIIPAAIAAQVLIAIFIPLGAGFLPVMKGARTNVRRAISNYRPDKQSTSQNIFVRSTHLVRWISRPILLSFRNTFRKTGRLLLTIFTLTVAGAVFIAVFNVRDSMNNVMGRLMQHFMGDVSLDFRQPYKISKIERSLLKIPGVVGVEGWGSATGDILDRNDDVVTRLSIVAPPQDTQLLDPDFVAGRWLLPDEKKAIVVSDTLYKFYPDLVPGDKLIVQITGERKEEWEVVGIFHFVDMLGYPLAYADYEFIAGEIHFPDQATSYRIITYRHDLAYQDDLAKRVDHYLTERNYAVQRVETGGSLQETASIGVNTLIIFLLIMAVLTAFVGSIGLTGTMSINVLERTREIGVMRTIGAVDIVIVQSVIIESLFIGLLTWLLAIGLSFPISTILLTIIGESMAGSPIEFTFTPLGILVWLGVVIVLSIFASIMPARNAARLTINEVLAYE